MIVVKCCSCSKLIGLKNDHQLEILESHTYCDACLDIEMGAVTAPGKQLQDRRTDPRYAIRLPVHLSVSTVGGLLEAGRYTTSDISSGGLHMRCRGALAIGTRVFISIMPPDAPPLTRWGTILRSDGNGMAFRYDAG